MKVKAQFGVKPIEYHNIDDLQAWGVRELIQYILELEQAIERVTKLIDSTK